MQAQAEPSSSPPAKRVSRRQTLLLLLLLLPLTAVSLAVFTCCYWFDLLDGGEAIYGVGHKRPFGTSRHPHLQVPEVTGPVAPSIFYRDRVLPLSPVLMRGAAATTRAFRLWDDNYFLSMQLDPAASAVHVETTKKESRKQRTYQAPFHQFVRSYNTSGHYMVASLPSFLVPDFPLPWSLQCPDVSAALVEAIVWFSSGGTSSVVHTDAVDNLNCVIRGNKTFILVDPAIHGDKVPIDRPEGAYSSIDVDSVDFRSYPGMPEAEFYIVKLVPGDCLYIPFKWIHQVRSYGRNIAVNMWFDKSLVRSVEGCADAGDAGWPIDTTAFKGFEYRSPGQIFAEQIREQNGGRPMDFEHMLRLTVPDHVELKQRFGNRFVDELITVFNAFDSNGDSHLDLNEINAQTPEALRDIDRKFQLFDQTMRRMLATLDAEKDEL